MLDETRPSYQTDIPSRVDDPCSLQSQANGLWCLHQSPVLYQIVLLQGAGSGPWTVRPPVLLNGFLTGYSRIGSVNFSNPRDINSRKLSKCSPKQARKKKIRKRKPLLVLIMDKQPKCPFYGTTLTHFYGTTLTRYFI